LGYWWRDNIPHNGHKTGIGCRANGRRKICTGESGDIGDIAKNDKIAMQKN